MILPFFLPKISMTSKLWQNDSIILFINRQNNSNKIISAILMFYPNTNKNVAFWNVLSVYTDHSRNPSVLDWSCSKYIGKHSQILSFPISIKLLDMIQVNFEITIIHVWCYIDFHSFCSKIHIFRTDTWCKESKHNLIYCRKIGQ